MQLVDQDEHVNEHMDQRRRETWKHATGVSYVVAVVSFPVPQENLIIILNTSSYYEDQNYRVYWIPVPVCMAFRLFRYLFKTIELSNILFWHNNLQISPQFN